MMKEKYLKIYLNIKKHKQFVEKRETLERFKIQFTGCSLQEETKENEVA